MKRVILLLMLSIILLGVTAEPVDGAERLRVAALPLEGSIRVDGVLGEADWGRAPPIGDFRLIFVREGQAPSESTDVRVLYDDAHLYFGIRCWNRAPGAVRASLAPRDQITDDDFIALHLDTFHDRRRAYVFGVNPYGVQLDGILTGQAPDLTWDGVWEAETRRDPDGWTAEIAVPTRTLRFAEHGDGVWGLWIRRSITKRDEVCSWPLWRQSEQGDIMLQAGDLTGLTGFRSSGGNLEVQPYVANARSEWREIGTDGGASPWSRSQELSGGVDARAAISNTLTLNATLNPDFSQIEADAIQIDVNQRFPLFYSEKRPFFYEGADVYAGLYNLVYTRRIADPSYGTKITGAAGRWRVGGFVVRDHGGGSLEGVGAGPIDGISKRGWFQIGRTALDIGDNNGIGLFVVNHSTDATSDPSGPLPAGPHTQNFVVAADARVRLARALFFQGQLIGTEARVNADSSGTSAGTLRRRLTDHGWSGWLYWSDGVRYAEIYDNFLGPEFRDEAGFFERVDFRESAGRATVTARPENAWLRSWQPEVYDSFIRDHAGRLEDRREAVAVDFGFQNQTGLYLRKAWVQERWLSRVYDRHRYTGTLSNTLWRPLALKLGVTLENGLFYGPSDAESYLGWLESYDLGATLRPAPRLTSELTAAGSRFSRSRGGARVYDIWVLGAKTTWQFTRRLYTRIYPQYDTGAGHLDLDALLGYVIHPGSVLYLGVGGDLDKRDGRHRTTRRTLFFKMSYVFQR